MRTVGTGIEFRWTHLHLLLHNKATRCHHGRCELQQDGSLSFSCVQPEDSGTYTLEVYDQNGRIQEKKVFILQVKGESTATPSVPEATNQNLLRSSSQSSACFLRYQQEQDPHHLLGRHTVSPAPPHHHVLHPEEEEASPVQDLRCSRSSETFVLQPQHGVNNRHVLLLRPEGGDPGLHGDAW